MSKTPGIKLILEQTIGGRVHHTEVGDDAWDLDLEGIIDLSTRLIKGAGWPLRGELGVVGDET